MKLRIPNIFKSLIKKIKGVEIKSDPKLVSIYAEIHDGGAKPKRGA